MSNLNSQSANQAVMYIGSYGALDEPTIHVCSFDESTGDITVLQQLSGLENASYLALHPSGRSLYAVSETANTKGEHGGSVAAYTIEEKTGKLTQTGGRFLTHGAHPCYVSVDGAGQALYVANYTGGNVALLPLSEDGLLEKASSVHQHVGELGPNGARQDTAHAHCIVPLKDTPYVFSADLGIDAIVIYRYDAERKTLERHGSCKLHRGAGPRHLVFHPHLPAAYVMNELDSTITLLKVDAEQGALTADQVISALPSSYDGYNDAADIHLAPSGRFLYSSNRGHNSIAVFAVHERNGELTLLQHIDCGGETPRNFALSPDGRHLLVAHQKSGTVLVFQADRDSGLLKQTDSRLVVPSPVCITFR